MEKSILLIEDSQEYRLIIESSLSGQYSLQTASTGQEALDILNKSQFDLVILDLTLPDLDGLQICNFMKTSSVHLGTPIIIVSGRDAVEDKVKGLDMGANDYLTKPFNSKELLARIRTHLRVSDEKNSNVIFGKVRIDLERHRTFNHLTGEEIELTGKEFALLTYLSSRVDYVISREKLIGEVWPNNISISDRTVDSHISNLRKKVSGLDLEIQSVQGSGYRLVISKN